MTATIHEMPAPSVEELEEEFQQLGDIDGVDVAFGFEHIPTLTPVSITMPLYAVEEELALFFETAEFVTPEQEEAFIADLGEAMKLAKAKRDRVGAFMSHMDAQREHAEREIERLSERCAVYSAAKERMEAYVVRILETFTRDERGRPPRLEGTTYTFTLRACPPSVDVRDEAEIPAEYKMVQMRMPAELWETMKDECSLEVRARVAEYEQSSSRVIVSRQAIKRAIDANVEVPGADIIIGKNSLVMR
jgi:hypothetical protein